MTTVDIKTLQHLLSAPKNIAIIPHKNPDGDAMGSTLGLSLYLQKIGHRPHVIVPNDYPKFLQWLPNQEVVVNFDRQRQQAEALLADADIIFTLDFNHFSRTGDMAPYLEKAKATFVMIDHHQQPDDYALVTYSDVHMSSTCEMVYNTVEFLGGLGHLDTEIATCLYTGIMTDTGSFKFASTTSKTHRIAAALIEAGADNAGIHAQVYDTNSPSRLHLLGCALNNMVIEPEYGTAYTYLNQSELDTNQFKKGDTEGFVNYGLTLEGISMAVIFIENKDEGIIKISFRSKGDFSVNEFARDHFEGGGHTNAAGGRSTDTLQATIARFTSLLPSYKTQLVP